MWSERKSTDISEISADLECLEGGVNYSIYANIRHLFLSRIAKSQVYYGK